MLWFVKVVSCHNVFFNLYTDGIESEAQAKTLERLAQLVGDGEEKWDVRQLLFADNSVLMADNKKLERLV